MSDQHTIITGGQIRMARAYLNWSCGKLAEKAGVSLTTINRIELEDGIPRARLHNIMAVKAAILRTGKIEFSGDYCVCIVPPKT